MPPPPDSPAPQPLPPGAEVELTIDKLIFGGQALARVQGLVVLMDHGLPGQRVRVRITRQRARYAAARVVEVLSPSPAQVAPCCPHFGLCGGCQWQDLAYAEQVRWKRLHVQEALRLYPGLADDTVRPPVASPSVRYYRNKMEFSFAPGKPRLQAPPDRGRASGDLAVGLYQAGSSEEIFNVEDCYLQSPLAPALVAEVRRWCRQSGLAAYNPRTRRGCWRFLVLRDGKRTGQILVHLITAPRIDPAAVAALSNHLQARFPAITTLVHSRSDAKAPVAEGEHPRTLWGPGCIEEELCGLRFRLSPQSFFQINVEAAELLYHTLRRLGEFTGRETVWDLYCGAGSIALTLAGAVDRVVGFELAPEAVNDAYANARRNGIDNCRFVAGDLKTRLQEAIETPRHYPRPEVVVTDPPRAGMHPQVLAALLALAPARLLYVSCNPATLARDLGVLQPGYHLAAVYPFDFFPHTAHIECLAVLARRHG